MDRYVLTGRTLSIARGYSIRDDNGGLIYQASGRNFTISREYSLKDSAGAEAFYIKSDAMRFSTYRIFRQDQLLAVVTKYLGGYRIEITDEAPIHVEAKRLGYLLRFTQRSVNVASLRRKYCCLTETRIIEVDYAPDAGLILACAVAITDMSS